MKQIIEDYVSLEIAKLLKEKGFNGECRMIYREHDMQMIYYTPNPNDLLDFTTNRKKLEKHSKKQHCDYALCPTHQMALKWLREVHGIFIDIMTYTTGSKIQFRWVGYDKGRLFSQEEGKTIYFDTHEQTVEAALKYTLENLI